MHPDRASHHTCYFQQEETGPERWVDVCAGIQGRSEVQWKGMRKKVLEAVVLKVGALWVPCGARDGFTKQCQHPVFLLCNRRRTSLTGHELKEKVHSRL